MRKTKTYTLTNVLIQRYADYLQEQERAGATIQKYVHDLTTLLDFLDGGPPRSIPCWRRSTAFCRSWAGGSWR